MSIGPLFGIGLLAFVVGIGVGIIVSPYTRIGGETFNRGVELGRKQQHCAELHSMLGDDGKCVVITIVDEVK